jgi:hypothetical protein
VEHRLLGWTFCCSFICSSYLASDTELLKHIQSHIPRTGGRPPGLKTKIELTDIQAVEPARITWSVTSRLL